MMAVAVRQSSLEKPQRGKPLSKVALIRPAIALLPLFQRFWWHTKAYGVSAGILLLLGSSLVVLWLHSFYRDSFKRARLSGNAPSPVNAHND